MQDGYVYHVKVFISFASPLVDRSFGCGEILSRRTETFLGVPMFLRVQYQNKKYDYVNAASLDKLIAGKQITKFLRVSQNEWIDIEKGILRGTGAAYLGPERKQIQAMSA
jgi:hypothetical protein